MVFEIFSNWSGLELRASKRACVVETKSLKTLILLLRMMSSRLCAMSQFIYLPIFKKNLFPCNILTFLSTHAFMAGYLYFIVRKKMSATRVCKMIYQNRKIHSVYPNLSKKKSFLFAKHHNHEGTLHNRELFFFGVY